MKLPGFSKESTDIIPIPSQLALRITPTRIQGAIWTKVANAPIDVLSLSAITTYLEGDIESLITQADLVLGECIEQLPDHVDEPHQVLFGLPSTWTLNGSLTEQGRQFLRQLSMKLELQALGTVGNIEAIVNFISTTQGVVNGILVGVDDEQLEVGLAVQGVVNSVANFKRSTDFVQDVKRAIGDFKQNHLPPKIILWGTDQDLSGLHQQLVSAPWQDMAVGFLHLPDIAMVPVNLPLEAVIFATEPHASNFAGKMVDNTPVPSTKVIEKQIEPALPVVEKLVEEQPDKIQIEDEFLANDQEELESETQQDNEELHAHAQTLTALGFVRDQDIREVTENAFDENRMVEMETITSEENANEMTLLKNNTLQNNQADWAKAVTQPSIEVPVVKKKKLKSLRWIIISIICIVLIAGLIGGLYAIWTTSSAKITIKVHGTDLTEAFLVVLDVEKTAVDLEAGILPAKIQTTEVTGSTSVNVTGKSTVGEKAKGEVTIFNDTDTSRTLSAGTKVTTTDSKKLVFTLDTSVQIASKSVDLTNQTSPFSPGVATVKVTAEKIGPDYNIAAQIPFSVANFSSSVLLARSDKAFGGGSSKEVRVVSKVDQQAANEQLKKKLSDEALVKINSQKTQAIELLGSSSVFKWKEQSFSHDINEEAESLTLSGTLTYSVLGYSTEDINTIAKQRLLNSTVDKDLIGQITTSFDINESSSSTGKYNFDVTAKARLMPKLVPDKIASKIAGQKTSDMNIYMKSLTSVSDVIPVRKPALPLWLDRYPPNPEKIQITIEPE